MFKNRFLATLLIIPLVVSCAFTLEKSSGKVGVPIINEELILAEVVDVIIERKNITESYGLKGYIILQNTSQETQSGNVSFELSSPDSYHPLWNSIISVGSIGAGQKTRVPFVFYHDSFENNLNFQEAEEDREYSSSSNDVYLFEFDFNLRSQFNDVRTSINYYRKR